MLSQMLQSRDDQSQQIELRRVFVCRWKNRQFHGMRFLLSVMKDGLQIDAVYAQHVGDGAGIADLKLVYAGHHEETA